jgi:hypothetical protein
MILDHFRGIFGRPLLLLGALFMLTSFNDA